MRRTGEGVSDGGTVLISLLSLVPVTLVLTNADCDSGLWPTDWDSHHVDVFVCWTTVALIRRPLGGKTRGGDYASCFPL